MTFQDMRGTGPRIEVLIGLPEPLLHLRQDEGRPVPEPFQAKAMIDTGASMTAIDPSVAQALGVLPRGTVTISTPSSPMHETNTYEIGLVFPTPRYALPLLPVIESPLASQGFHCLIGRDVLSQGLLVYEGYGNRFILSF